MKLAEVGKGCHGCPLDYIIRDIHSGYLTTTHRTAAPTSIHTPPPTLPHANMKAAAILAVAAAALCLASVQGEYLPVSVRRALPGRPRLPASDGRGRSGAACKPGLVNLGDDEEVCVYFYRSKSTWHGMRTNCQVLGLDLATLTGTLHQRVIQYINSQPGRGFWAGGTDEAFEGSWRWIHDSKVVPLGTPHWYDCRKTDEPDGGTKKNYMCLHNRASTSQLLWHR
ncbi:CD209 antigen [Chionoecetes opilio]|uniref:CD209 antigen n=1 Tax=Chionoecetes opilio TaxID=41210 RepID=A0A8J5CL24_CHIOP|nr:CD209 antigen [Chionoecetes opilio]